MADMNGRNNNGSKVGVPNIFGAGNQGGAKKPQSTGAPYQGDVNGTRSANSPSSANAGYPAAPRTAPRPALRKKVKLNKGRVAAAAAVLAALIALIVVLACGGNRELKSEVKNYIVTETGYKSGSVKVRSDVKPSKEKMEELFGDGVKVKGIYIVTGKYGKFTGEGTAPAEPAKGEYFLLVVVRYKKDGDTSYEMKTIGSYADEDAVNVAVAECEKNIEGSLAAASQPAA